MVGITRTKDIVMRSRRIPGCQAYEWGVATECVKDADLESATDALVAELRGFAPLAQRTAKKLLNDTEDATLSLAIELIQDSTQVGLAKDHDVIQAFPTDRTNQPLRMTILPR